VTAPFDPYESKQDIAELNACTLIGCTDERGDAWHRRDDLMTNGNNHYPGLIPTADLYSRLFTWKPRRAEVAFLVPTDQYRKGVVEIDGQWMRVVRTSEDRIGVLRDDNDYDLGVFKSGAMHPPYQVTLVEEAERLVGTQLGVSSAGVLQKGARAWVEFSLPETQWDTKSGFGYRPNLVIADSMDGSISLTKAVTVNATVCMNTLRRNLLEAGREGFLTRRKHSKGIVGSNLDQERKVLNILEVVDEEFLADLHKLIETPVSDKQRIEVMDIMVPLTEDMSERSRKLAETKRDRLVAWNSSEMVAPWLGTAWGEFQRYSTDQHWGQPPKGTGRWERNTWRTIMGKSGESDAKVIEALEMVLAQ
jgi:phage/plasmid-like protein (TIGR03299 family)